MDSHSKIMGSMSRRGQVTILVGGIIVVFLLLFFVVGIDFARVYYVRGELQNAADSAALAGGKQLDGTNNVLQTPARQAAWKFACRNSAAHANVYLVATGADCNTPPPDLNNANAPTGDIVLGNWNLTRHPNFESTRTPINAVQIAARRVGIAGTDSPGGSVSLLFGKLVGWPTMDVVRVATATKEISFAPMPICIDTCTNLPNTPLNTNPQGILLTFQQPTCPPHTPELTAWTDFEEIPGNPTPNSVYALLGVDKQGNSYSLIDPISAPNGCGSAKCLRTKQGIGSILPAITAIVQGRGKTYQVKGHSVFGWRTFLPIFEGCAPGTPCVTPTVKPCPGDQATGYEWVQDAEIIITGVQETGPNAGIYVVGLDESPSSPDESKLKCVTCSDPSVEQAAVVKLVK
jgi:Flp pilus assembly protein TadG